MGLIAGETVLGIVQGVCLSHITKNKLDEEKELEQLKREQAASAKQQQLERKIFKEIHQADPEFERGFGAADDLHINTKKFPLANDDKAMEVAKDNAIYYLDDYIDIEKTRNPLYKPDENVMDDVKIWLYNIICGLFNDI